MKQRIERDENLAKFKLNSAMELVADETDDFDILNNEETETQVDFSPLFEAMHIRETLGQTDHFKAEYAATRRRQKELTIPTSLDLLDDDEADMSSLLESIAGFAIVGWPADYGASGIMTFVVSHQGVIYQKDLGKDTAKIAGEMNRYDPDDTWTEVKEDDK